jgi:hypothetical protein
MKARGTEDVSKPPKKERADAIKRKEVKGDDEEEAIIG